ncbi:hypothetical protein LPJ53_005050 [Coemansia erecta]|uniref:Uncharacterized protein n=1 Tax=Coemansia erecta TaxID=147472 RepID=A0A9W7XT75_9FUNG|nr:hypothetical protein LPJ53_005050 [Coemansia erecta]
MGRVSASQVLHRLKRNGTYDAMRQEMQTTFAAGPRGQEFAEQALEILQSATADRAYQRLPPSERSDYLGQRLQSRLAALGFFERLDTEARNFWLSAARQAQMHRRIVQAAREAAGMEQARRESSTGCRALEVDPPRISSNGRTHNFYRRGETVAAFVALGDPLCTHAPYICLAAEILACDAQRNAYTIVDPDAAASGGQATWAVHWDQIIVNKRAHEYAYREGEQVYAMYREDAAAAGGGEAGMRVTTEYFPARVERVGAVSVAVRFDAGGLAHVYYDELFAAGKIGFLRRCSEMRRRREGMGSESATVESLGRQVPSFTGFWPDQACPALGKHGRRVRYRQPPPMLVAYEPRAESRGGVLPGHTESAQSRGGVPPSHAESAQSLSAGSDMDTASSSSHVRSPSPPRVPASLPPPPPSLPPPSLPVPAPAPAPVPAPLQHAPSAPARSRQPSTSDEEGEIALPGAGAREEGEFIGHDAPRARQPRRPSVERPRRSRSPEGALRHRASRWDRGPEPQSQPHLHQQPHQQLQQPPSRYSRGGARYDERRSTYGGRDTWYREADPRDAWRRSPEHREHRERRRSRSRMRYAPYGGEYEHR